MSTSANPLWIESSLLVGINLGSIAFGASFIVYMVTVHALWYKKVKHRLDIFLFGYITALFISGLVYEAFDIHNLRLEFSDGENSPGGPLGYIVVHYSSTTWVINNAAFVVSEWLADGFLLFRCLMIFRSNLIAIVLPVLLYLGCISLGIVLQYQTAQPNATLWAKASINFALAYFSMSATLNILITVLIASRLLLFRRSVRQMLGSEHAGSIPYVSIVAVFVESSSLYAAAYILFIGPYGAGSNACNLFLPVLGQVQIISPTLIVYRIATLKAWDSNTARSSGPISTIRFETRPAPLTTTSPTETHDLQTQPAKHVTMHLLPSATSAGLETEEPKA